MGNAKVSAPEKPYPGDELAYRVQGGTGKESFHSSGKRSVEELEKALGAIGKTWDSFESILDFGCGSGRMMLWMDERAPAGSLHGVDTDARAIKWAQQNLPFATFKVNQPLPPLPYPDGFFDLVFNHSVFTHINREYQDQWLAELRRVTKPGATLVLSVHGKHAFGLFEHYFRTAGGNPDPLRSQLERDGILFLQEDTWTGSSMPDYYHTSYHSPDYLFEHWGRFFDIRGYLPRGDLDFQDLLLLERPEGPIAEPRAPVLRGPKEVASAPPTGLPWDRVASLLQKGPQIDSPSRNAQAARTFRKAVLRVLRHYTEHQTRIDEGLLDSVRHLNAEHNSLQPSLITIRETLKQQGERTNRLEADIFAALEKLESRKDDHGASG